MEGWLVPAQRAVVASCVTKTNNMPKPLQQFYTAFTTLLLQITQPKPQLVNCLVDDLLTIRGITG
jgi:hypothetical protein